MILDFKSLNWQQEYYTGVGGGEEGRIVTKKVWRIIWITPKHDVANVDNKDERMKQN
jgi:hypothetical protein